MKCAYCGKKNKDGALYCKRCGIGLPAPKPGDPEGGPAPARPAETAPAENSAENGEKYDWTVPDDASSNGKKRRKELVLIPILAAAALIIALVIWLAAASRGEILPPRSGCTDLGSALAYGGQIVAPEGESIASSSHSVDGRTFAVITESGKLYSCVKGEFSLIANYVESCVCSANGKRIIYADENGLLWKSECTEPESAPVCICNLPVSPDYVVSPDGESVLYNLSGEKTLRLFSGKKETVVSEGHSPIAVSNGARYIFSYSASDNALYRLDKRGRATFLRSNLAGEIWLNSTHNELVFCTDSGDGKFITMICVNGSDPVTIANTSAPLSPVMTVRGMISKADVSGTEVVTCPYKSFEGRFFAGAGLARYSRNGSELIEPNDCAYAAAADNYSAVFYITNGSLQRISSKSGAEPEKLCEAESFLMSSNGAKIWYVSPGGELVYRSGSAERVVAPGVDLYSVNPSNGAVIFTYSGGLYRNSEGRANRTFAFDGAEALLTSADSRGLYALTGEGWQAFTSGGSRTDLTK